jgi:hypothetical protein
MTQTIEVTPKKAKQTKSTGMLEIMDHTGDTKIMWSKDNADEVDAARTQFNTLIAKKFTAFRVVGKDGKPGEQIREFDPTAERIIMSPPVQGG